MKKCIAIFCLIICVCLTSCDKGNIYSKENDKNAVLAANFDEEELIKEQEGDEEPQIYTVKMRAVGDIMTHDYQLDVAYDKNDNSYNFDKQFELIKKYIEEADIAIGNLESTLEAVKEAIAVIPNLIVLILWLIA